MAARKSGGSGGGARFAVRIAIQAHDLATRVVKRVAAGIGSGFKRILSSIRSVVDFGAKLGTVFQTWGSWALEAGRKIGGLVMETSDVLSRISDLSTKTGVSTTALQELAYAAGQTGVETDALFKGVEAMSRKFGDMAAGGRELSSFLLQTGGPAFLKQAKAARTNEERLDLMLAALGKIEGEERRAAFATKVFGKSGEDLVLMLSEGTDGLRDFRAQAHQFGVVQGPEAVAAAEEFGDEVQKVEAAWGGAKRTFGSEVMRQLLPMIKQVTEWIAKNPAKIREVASELAGGVVTAVTKIKDGIAWIWEHRGDIEAWATGLAAAFAAAAVALNPILAGIAILAAMGAAAKPKTQAEQDKALLAGSKKNGTLGGVMALGEGPLNNGGFLGLAERYAQIGAYVQDERQILAEAKDREQQRNFEDSKGFNDTTRAAVLAVQATQGSGLPQQEQSLEITLNIKDPGNNARVERVAADGVAPPKVKKTGQRTLGTGL